LAVLAPNVYAFEPSLPNGLKLAWVADPGAEGIPATPRAVELDRSVWVNVPGATVSFSVAADGSLTKLRRLATDYSSAYGMAISPTGAVVANRQGTITLWSSSSLDTGPQLRWSRDLGKRVMSVAWDGRNQVWAGTWDGELVALRSDSGERLWSLSIGGRAEAPAMRSEKDVFIATKAGALFGIDAATGVIRWKTDLAGPVIHPPAVEGGGSPRIFCGTWSGHLSAFTARSGNPLWSVELPAKQASPPVVGFDRVAVVTEDGAVHVHDLDGRLIWRAAEVADGPASLSITARSDGRPRLLVVSKRLTALDLATGGRLDSYPDGAVEDLRRRFLTARMEGEKTYSEAEKNAALEREAFPISGPVFGVAQVYGGGLFFGTEDGWTYLFDAATLRPTYRYRVGQPISGRPRLVRGRVVAAAGEEVFALAPETGQTLWRRGVGGNVKAMAGGSALAVLTSGHLSILDAADGSRAWTQRIPARFVSAASAPTSPLREDAELWFVGDESERLQALDHTGRVVGELAAEGELLRLVHLSSKPAWAAATTEGRVFGFDWVAPQPAPGSAEELQGKLGLTWERTLDSPASEIRSAHASVLVRLEDGWLVSLSPRSGEEIWRLRLFETEEIALASEPQALLVFGGDTVRVYDLATGELRFAYQARPPAVGIELHGRRLRWLDRSGRAYTADVEDGELLARTDLGVALDAAVPSPAGFLIKTSAGEVGIAVEAGRGGAAAAPAFGKTH
jgi:outer membrane protein assembly factor BamB